MAYIRPFAAIRPAAGKAEQVASLPYDVMDVQEARDMAAGNPSSFLHISRAEIDLPPDTDVYSPLVYQTAKENLQKMLADGVLQREEKPCLYIYRQIRDGRSQTGIVGCSSVDDYRKGLVKDHERTRRDKENDRTRHINITNAQTGPIFLAYHSRPAIVHILADAMKNEPLYDFVFDGETPVQQTVWRIDDDVVIGRIQDEFMAAGRIYIADGHHRCASSARVRDKRQAASEHWTGNEEANFTLSVFFPGEQLHIMDYNRVVADLNGLSVKDFLSQVKVNFEVEKYAGEGTYRPENKHQFGMYLDGCWYCMSAKEGSFDARDPIAQLDVAILQNNLLEPILDIEDPRTDARISFIGGVRGLGELERKVQQGAAVAFAMYPTSIDELFAVADSGGLMPPKSTWFEPKLLSGLFIHELD